MGWFEDIPNIFLTVIGLIALVSLAIFILSIDWGNPDKSEENLDKITGKLSDVVVPTEVNWIDKVVNTINNPYLLLFVIIFILTNLVIRLAAKIVTRSLSFVMLGWLNRLLGAAFGFIKSIIIMSFFVFLFDN